MAAQVQAHGNVKAVAELAAQIALATRWPADMIAQALLCNERTVLGITDVLVRLRGTGVLRNPADHLCMARQVLCPR